MTCGGQSSGLLVGTCLSGLRRGNMTMKPDEWVAESRPIAPELTDDFVHADFIPTVAQRMEGHSIDVWVAMAKEVR